MESLFITSLPPDFSQSSTDINVSVAGKSTDYIMVESPLSEDTELEFSSPKAKRARGSRTLVTPKLAAALDKCKISDKDAVHILIATTELLGHDVQDFIIYRSSIYIAREEIRVEKATGIKR